jgi:hypothetical protein
VSSSSFSTYLDITKTSKQGLALKGAATDVEPPLDARNNAAKVLAAALNGSDAVGDLVSRTELGPTEVLGALAYLAENQLVTLDLSGKEVKITLTDAARHALES